LQRLGEDDRVVGVAPVVVTDDDDGPSDNGPMDADEAPPAES
jgi:hypothetical protein